MQNMFVMQKQCLKHVFWGVRYIPILLVIIHERITNALELIEHFEW